MNGSVLREFIETAKKANQAVELEGPSIEDDVIIEPTDVCEWRHTNMLWVDEQLIDITYVSYAKVVPNRQEREKKYDDLMKKIRREVYGGTGGGNMIL